MWHEACGYRLDEQMTVSNETKARWPATTSRAFLSTLHGAARHFVPSDRHNRNKMEEHRGWKPLPQNRLFKVSMVLPHAICHAMRHSLCAMPSQVRAYEPLDLIPAVKDTEMALTENIGL